MVMEWNPTVSKDRLWVLGPCRADQMTCFFFIFSQSNLIARRFLNFSVHCVNLHKMKYETVFT